MACSRYRFSEPPSGPEYAAVMRALSGLAAVGSVIVRDHSQFGWSGRAAAFLRSIEPHIRERREVNEWPLTQIGGDETPTMVTFRLESEVIASILRNTSGFRDFRQPAMPEDLALYRADGTLLLGSVAHENTVLLDLNESDLQVLMVLLPASVRARLVKAGSS